MTRLIEIFKDGGPSRYFDPLKNSYLRWHEMEELIKTNSVTLHEFKVGPQEMTLILKFERPDEPNEESTEIGDI